jgi:hypothetical protein
MGKNKVKARCGQVDQQWKWEKVKMELVCGWLSLLCVFAGTSRVRLLYGVAVLPKSGLDTTTSRLSPGEDGDEIKERGSMEM